MRRNLALVLGAAILSLSVVRPAAAGIYIEPYLGYTTGKFTLTGNPDSDVKGLSYGARLGYSFLGFMLAAEYMTGKLKTDSTPEADVTPQNLGASVGYTFPILVRAYASYFPKAKSKTDDGTGESTFEGKATKLGVGFTGLPFVVINLEYMTTEFDEIDGVSLPAGVEAKEKSYSLNISLPLDF